MQSQSTSVTPSGSTNPTSTLTIDTTAAVAPGSYSITTTATSGSTVHSTSVTLTVQSVQPDFTIATAPGSQSSQTISAGQTATFTLALAPTGSFNGTVNLGCTITPAVAPAPTCSLSSSSVQLSGSGTQTVSVTAEQPRPPRRALCLTSLSRQDQCRWYGLLCCWARLGFGREIADVCPCSPCLSWCWLLCSQSDVVVALHRQLTQERRLGRMRRRLQGLPTAGATIWLSKS